MYRAKVKTPFELVASTLRAMGAVPDTAPRAAGIVGRLGQPIWGRLTPDGWPDQSDAWMNAGALLNRVHFVQAVAADHVPGVTLARWAPASRILAMPPRDAVDAVIVELLQGRASDETRHAMLASAESPETPRRLPLSRLGELVAIAIGSPEFQHR